jgi:hypothetical protein
MSEQNLVNAILEYLHLMGAWAIRINAGARPVENKDGSRRMIHMAPPGTPDIIGVWRGQPLFVECKLPGNKATATQLACHDEIRRAGGVVIVAYCVEDVEKDLERRMYVN